MLKVYNDFERRPDLLARFDEVASAIRRPASFADVMYRTGRDGERHQAAVPRQGGRARRSPFSSPRAISSIR
jgi:hypothetical protein